MRLSCGGRRERRLYRRTSNTTAGRLIILGLAGCVGSVLFGLSASASADELVGGSDPIAELRNYVLSASAKRAAEANLNQILASNASERDVVFDGSTIAAHTIEVKDDDDQAAALRSYLDQVASPRPVVPAGEDADQAPGSITRGEIGNDPYAALRAYVQGTAVERSQPSKNLQKLAEADNAFDALREFLQRHNGSAPPSAPAPAPRQPSEPPPPIAANIVGSAVCLGCHAGEADAYGFTLMGRLQKQGKLQCETCHGPGSAHVLAAGCASCHGDGGVSRRAGMPSLVGQEPAYLIAAMKEYVSGQRKHALMRALLSGLGDAEISSIAYYYARQAPERAQTPPVGDASAGRAAIGSCIDCHGERGVSISPTWPNLAGQDAQSLADALNAFKHGTRNKTVACAACHGDRGISSTPGMPSLVGLDAQYLVAAMKEYASGQRKNAVMKELLAGISDKDLNSIALYYARQNPARAQTPLVGDPAAGKTAAAACVGCHVAQGVSPNPAWPGVSGQDARYHAEAMHAYKNGSRSDATMKAMVESLDDKTINDIASYYATLAPTQPNPAQGAASPHDPALVRNGLVASLDERAINNIASYYASLTPVQPAGAKNAPSRREPNLVTRAAPPDGYSAGGIISFREDDPGRTVEQNNAICLGCHERGQRTYWEGSVHQERGVACTNCHTVMKAVSAQGQLKTAFQPDTCFQCHKDRRAQMFRSAHMPMREGKIVCSDCHNPHGSATVGLLWTNSINDTCYKCHAEKRGPFLFEHTPVRENCLNCHDPHGSINEASLKISRPRLCFECHTIGPHGSLGTTGPFSSLTMGRGCTNCHTMIHGTNSPAGGALMR